jgi:hypothetical protein
MGAAQLPLEIEQGADCILTIAVVGGPDSLSGYQGAMQIRQLKADTTFLYEVDSSNITFDVGNRIVTVRIPYEDTEGFDWNLGVYDVRIKVDGVAAWRIAEGKVTVDHWVTRADA